MQTTAEEPIHPRALAGVPAVVTFDELFTTYNPFVWRTLRRLGVAASDAEDVCQEVFVAVHRKLDSFEGRSSVRTWLYGICVHAASNHRRRSHVRREVVSETPPEQIAAPDQQERLERQQALALLDDLLNELDHDRRAVFVLYEIEQLSMNEIASAVGCPLQTAYSRLHAARKQLEATVKRLQARREMP